VNLTFDPISCHVASLSLRVVTISQKKDSSPTRISCSRAVLSKESHHIAQYGDDER